MRRFVCVLSVLAILTCVAAASAQQKGAKKADRPKPQPQAAFLTEAEAGPDFKIQGEYSGPIGEDKTVFGVQVIALGDGKFHAVAYRGGLPGAGWDGSDKLEGEGHMQGDAALFGTKDGEQSTGVIRADVATIKDADGKVVGTLNKVHRQSPTLGVKPPAGAVVLFDGTTADHFLGGRVTPGGLLMEGATSKEKFQSFTAHVEFLLPFMPTARGQGRANSGVYAQGRYETQVLDSFGLKGEDNECGGLYKISKPRVNMCLPPLAWQTYDIDFTTAKYQDGKKVEDAQLTVRHNGVLIQENVKLPHATVAAPVKEGPEPGPLFLQNHGNPVRFRNVWVVNK